MQQVPRLRGRFLHVGTRPDDRELVATDPEEMVLIAEDLAHRAGESLDHRVARRVPVGVVHSLEVVEVDHQQDDLDAVAQAQVGLASQLVAEGAVVAEVGHPVRRRDVACLAVEGLEVGFRCRERVDRPHESACEDAGSDDEHDGPEEGEP